MQFEKEAPPGFECETRGNLSSLSFVVVRALMSVATAADCALYLSNDFGTKWIFWHLCNGTNQLSVVQLKFVKDMLVQIESRS